MNFLNFNELLFTSYMVKRYESYDYLKKIKVQNGFVLSAYSICSYLELIKEELSLFLYIIHISVIQGQIENAILGL